MPSFRYETLNPNGRAQAGVIEAPDRAAAVRLLSLKGQTPMTVESADTKPVGRIGRPARPKPKATKAQRTTGESRPALAWRGKSTLSRAEMANFIRELATAIEAGLPLMQSLRTVRRQAGGAALPVILDHLIDRVESGAPLHAAAREYGKPFDDLTIGMLRAADASGEMHKILHQLADLLDRSVELRREMLGAAFYPLIVAGLVLISVVILVTFLVPRLIGPIAADTAFQMPLPTQIVLSTAEFLTSWWWLCLLAVAVFVLGWRSWVKIPANRLRVDLFKLRIPLYGRLVRDVAVARFTRTLGTLVAAGIPILDALRITSGTLGNHGLIAAVDEVQDKVTSGAALADPLERSGLFPPLLVQIVNLGEKSGRLEGMLLHAAGAFDRQVNNSVKLFGKALPPILLAIMAVIGGFVLAAILLPMLELQSMVR